ncbi:MAG: rRNA cytosine-C5-methyltransferase, partial [Candidatus Rokuibacteriota bacterium]
MSAAPGRGTEHGADAARPSAARTVAAQVLERVEMDGAFADLALNAALERRSLPWVDAARATELGYRSLRGRRFLDWILAPHSVRPLPTLDPR